MIGMSHLQSFIYDLITDRIECLEATKDDEGVPYMEAGTSAMLNALLQDLLGEKK